MKEEILPHLDKLSIYQLRTIGRRIGVHLPTTLKKKDLIQKITAIACGEEKPCVKTSNRGRPAKLIGAMSFKKEDETYGSIFGDLEEYYKLSTPDLASCEAIKLKEIPNVEEIIMTGYVEISSDGYAYFLTSPQLSSEPVYVKVSTVAKYNLKRGDIIEAKILKDPNTKCSIVEDIIRVNDYNPQKMPITYDFSNQQKMSKNKFIFPVMQNSLSEVENIAQIYCGDRVLLSIEEKRTLPIVMYEMLKKLNNSSNITHIVFLGTDVSAEFIEVISNLDKLHLAVSGFGDAKSYTKKIFEMAFLHTKTLTNIQGNNVAFVVQNLSEALQVFSDKELDEISDYCKKYFLSAKQCENSSLTCIYSFVSDNEMQRQYETNENVFIKYLPHKHLTKSKIKFNILESFRTEIFAGKNVSSNLQQKVENFLENGNYLEQHSKLEMLLERYENTDEFLKNI